MFDDKPPLNEALLIHYGVKGMHWGVRKQRKLASQNLANLHYAVKVKNTSRVRGVSITDEQYSKLNTTDKVFRAGSHVKRTTRDPFDVGQHATFVSTNEKDAEIYRALLPVRGKDWAPVKDYGKNYEITLKATKDLKSPSEKTRVDAYVKLMSAKTISLDDGRKVTGREYLSNIGLGDSVKSLSNHQIALTYYGQLTALQGLRDEPLSSAYFKSLSKKGYNALIDDNDRGLLSDEPLLIFKPDGSLKTLEVRQLSNDEILKAQTTIKVPAQEGR